MAATDTKTPPRPLDVVTHKLTGWITVRCVPRPMTPPRDVDTTGGE